MVAFPKSEIAKRAPVVSVKIEQKKTASLDHLVKTPTKKSHLIDNVKLKSVSTKSKTGEQNSESRNITASTKQEKGVSILIKKPKSRIEIPSPVNSTAEPNLKKEKAAPVTVQKDKRAEKISKVLPIEKNEAKILKKNKFFSINKLKVIERKVSLASEKTDRKSEEDTKLSVPTPESLSIETELAAKAALRKSKPKKVKPIGPAIFRGRKERYDFQVYPLDAEIVDVPAIYIISKRKTDKQKRAHHALICIGETNSISDEIKRHRKGKCVKKHEANVISILPEANEKKRLKIETDLKAAHAVVCNLE